MFRMCAAALVYYNYFLKEHLHRYSMARTSIFLTETIPLANFVTTRYPWNNTSATPEMTVTPADLILMANMKYMKFIISDLKSLLETSFKTTLARDLDAREVGGSAYAQSKDIMTKLDTLLLRSTALSSSEPEHIEIDDTGGFVNIEDDVVFFLEDEEKSANNMVDNPNILSTGARDRIVRQKNSKQRKSRTLTMGCHHCKLNPLPSTWQYTNGFTVIQLMKLCLIGNRKENVPPLAIAGADSVSHIDDGSRIFSKMRQVMSKVE